MSAFGKSAPVPTLGESYNMGFERGQVLERERIIKLLEAEAMPTYDGDQVVSLLLGRLIALIKGEK